MPHAFRLLAAAAVAISAALAGAPASGQRVYPTPEAAAQAFTDALATHYLPALHTVLGAD